MKLAGCTSHTHVCGVHILAYKRFAWNWLNRFNYVFIKYWAGHIICVIDILVFHYYATVLGEALLLVLLSFHDNILLSFLKRGFLRNLHVKADRLFFILNFLTLFTAFLHWLFEFRSNLRLSISFSWIWNPNVASICIVFIRLSNVKIGEVVWNVLLLSYLIPLFDITCLYSLHS